ncbi:uncharacterized protein LOC114731857 [Neltuma alba]|uniref:uncharacterized protein LOC114731857 n=1 Tax=Neltuma alba TaxID=207710 RepID=UPI0010A2C7FC|nr:uncharacterized protein LOC114731857 [Prosopis alba]
MGMVVLPFLGMVMAECAQVGLIIVSKIVMSHDLRVPQSQFLLSVVFSHLGCSAIWHRYLGMLGFTTALLHSARLCSTLSVDLPSFLLLLFDMKKWK